MSVQPAKPALPIRVLYEEIPNAYVFFAHTIFTTFCAPFPKRISHLKILVMPLAYVLNSLLTRTQVGPKGTLTFHSLEVEKKLLILSYFQSK